MRRRGTRERVRHWACGAGPGCMAILRGRDANGTSGACAGGGAGPVREVGTGETQGACASQGGWVGRLACRLVRPLCSGDGIMDPSP
jgi:hypothetical protein